MAGSRVPHSSVFPAFRPSAKLVSPTTPSADFCVAVRSPCDDLSPVARTPRRPPEVRPTAFAARPPDLPPRPLMTVDFAISCSLVRPGRPRYPVLVHRAADLLHAFFRPHLAMTPLRFANPSPSSGWVEDFHLQAVVHTRHTTKNGGAFAPPSFDFGCGSLSAGAAGRLPATGWRAQARRLRSTGASTAPGCWRLPGSDRPARGSKRRSAAR
jgi:hypothetical protein